MTSTGSLDDTAARDLRTACDDPTVALCCDLIQRASVTPEDAGCQTVMQERLTALGFRCTPLPFGNTQNFWAEWGSEGPLLAFAGHTDVVPTGPLDDWDSPPFTPSLRDGLLFGRGAADMKGSLAAMITACERFTTHTPKARGRIGFLITSDEEGPATDGTVKVMAWLAEQDRHIDFCIVGEPSSGKSLGDVIKNGRRGSLGAVVTIHGRQGHVAYPQHAENPIHRALGALKALTERTWDAGNRHFPPTSFQLTNVHAGTGATNVIPGSLELWMNFRFSTEQTAAALQDAVRDLFEEHKVAASITWNLSGEPFLTEEGVLVDACRDAIREETAVDAALSTSGGTSDGRFIAPYGAELVELGPINASIHRVNEHVKVDDLPRLSRIYEGIMAKLLR